MSYEHKLKSAARWLSLSMDSDFKPEQEAELEKWLEKDLSNRQAFEEMSRVWNRFECLSHVYAKKDINIEESDQAWHKDKPFQRLKNIFSSLYSLKFAFSIAVFGLIIFFCFPFIYKDSFEPLTSISVEYTKKGEQKNIILDDGSVLEMNVNTLLIVEMSKKLRKIKLDKGEVFFKVSPDEKRPFEVVTPLCITRVLGTSFNVRNRKGQVSVDVKQGRVRVSACPSGLGDMRIQSLVLTGDRGVDIGADGRFAPLRKSSINNVLAWKQGKVIFNNAPVSEILEELELYHPVKIELKADEIKNSGISGSFYMRDLDETLSLISIAASLKIEKKSEHLIILKSNS
ncbi:MAG: hypothetical protein CSA42_00210 [Gammaproteobacteria bacterium]|nr:MAG: hypothetical protein CSA42_00210 [Gammaproteobacteria bacterium]